MATRSPRATRIALDYEAIHRAADAQVPAARDSIVAALDVAYESVTDLEASLAYSISIDEWRRAVDWEGVARALGATSDAYTLYKAAAPSNESTASIFGQTSLSGAQIAADGLTGWSGTTISLDLTNTRAVAYGQQRAGALISGLQREQIEILRNTLGRSLSEGIDAMRVGRMLRSTVGMNARQAVSLVNYERGLNELMTTGRTSVGLRGIARPLADQRFSLTRLDTERIDRLVERYRQRLINYRAEMIARTETMRAANMGAYAEYYAHGQQGLFDLKTARRVWTTTPDDRACDVCIFMDGHEVGFAESFVYDGREAGNSNEDVLSGETPPIHPMCRCSTYIEISIESLADAFAAGPIDWSEQAVDLGDWTSASGGIVSTPHYG